MLSLTVAVNLYGDKTRLNLLRRMKMEVKKLWESIFTYDTYKKGADYSASDITTEPLIARLRKEFGTNGVKYEDKIASFIGTSVHERIEQFIKAENEFGATNMQSEVKLKFKNLSGTADLILDGSIVLDFKTGKESNIRASILDVEKKRKSSWQEQLSIYAYLNHKQNGVEYGELGYIAWLCVSPTKEETDEHATFKRGILKVPLLSLDEVKNLIKEFMVDMKKSPDELDKCKMCLIWQYRFCGVRDHCPYWKEEEDMSKIDDW